MYGAIRVSSSILYKITQILGVLAVFGVLGTAGVVYSGSTFGSATAHPNNEIRRFFGPMSDRLPHSELLTIKGWGRVDNDGGGMADVDKPECMLDFLRGKPSVIFLLTVK